VSRDDVPELVIEDRDESILALLRTLQRAVLTHPEAAQALYGALVEEGRLFAQTAEGRRWQERLEGSALLERALLVWQNASLWVTEERADGAAPSALVDAVAAAAASPARDVLLERLFRDVDGGA
jgi:hypothetical protein